MQTARFQQPSMGFWCVYAPLFVAIFSIFSIAIFTHVAHAQSGGDIGITEDQSTLASDDTVSQGSDGTETGSTNCTADEIESAQQRNDVEYLESCGQRAEGGSKLEWTNPGGLPGGSCIKSECTAELEDIHRAWQGGRLIVDGKRLDPLQAPDSHTEVLDVLPKTEIGGGFSGAADQFLGGGETTLPTDVSNIDDIQLAPGTSLATPDEIQAISDAERATQEFGATPSLFIAMGFVRSSWREYSPRHAVFCMELGEFPKAPSP